MDPASLAACLASSTGISKSHQPPKKLDIPKINTSRQEAQAIQDAIRKLGNVRAEVEAEVMTAIDSSGNLSHARRMTECHKGHQNYIAAGFTGSIGVVPKSGKGSRHQRRKGSRLGSGTVQFTAAAETQQLVPQFVFGHATKKLNVHPNERLYHDLLELNVPPTTVKLKRAPQCEKKVDPVPCLEDYIKPQYCCIKPVRDYMGTWAKCKIPEPSKEIALMPVCPDPNQDDDYRRDCQEEEFGVG